MKLYLSFLCFFTFFCHAATHSPGPRKTFFCLETPAEDSQRSVNSLLPIPTTGNFAQRKKLLSSNLPLLGGSLYQADSTLDIPTDKEIEKKEEEIIERFKKVQIPSYELFDIKDRINDLHYWLLKRKKNGIPVSPKTWDRLHTMQGFFNNIAFTTVRFPELYAQKSSYFNRCHNYWCNEQERAIKALKEYQQTFLT